MAIYEMDLHDEIEVDDTRVTRVPGGWIYTFTSYDDRNDTWRISSVFVPYNNEFQRKEMPT
jgi:hypothetical protein